MTKNLTLKFSAFAPSLSAQLAAQNCTADPTQIDLLDKDRHDLQRLYIRGYITPSTYDRGIAKVGKEVCKLATEVTTGETK